VFNGIYTLYYASATDYFGSAGKMVTGIIFLWGEWFNGQGEKGGLRWFNFPEVGTPLGFSFWGKYFEK